MRNDLKAKQRQFVFDPLLNRQPVKRMKHRSAVGRFGCSENESCTFWSLETRYVLLLLFLFLLLMLLLLLSLFVCLFLLLNQSKYFVGYYFPTINSNRLNTDITLEMSSCAFEVFRSEQKSPTDYALHFKIQTSDKNIRRCRRSQKFISSEIF